MFTIADSSSIITKHTQTMACAHRWRGRHCFWTPTTDPRGKTPPATPLYERTMDRSGCRYIVRLHLVQCVRRNQTKGQEFSFDDIFKKWVADGFPSVFVPQNISHGHNTFKETHFRSFSRPTERGKSPQQPIWWSRYGEFPPYGWGGVSKTSFFKSGVYILTLA